MPSTTGGASHAVWTLLICGLCCLTGCPPTGEPPPFAPVGEGGAGGAAVDCEDRDGDGYVSSEGCALPAGDCAPDDAARHPAAPEICNLIDDNCNRDTDEGNPGGGMDCDTGLDGICAAGATTCMQGELACVQVEDRAPRETCNSEDDDCDGRVDEDDPEGGARCDTGLDGVCAPGVETCFSGELSCIPEAQALAERCNGEDDDCDGEVDEENPGGGSDCATDLLGECAMGAETCENGDLICRGTFERRDEQCDQRDDDCDGSTDEAFLDLGEACTVGDGECQRDGVRVCAPDGNGTICGVDAGNAVEELCNGEDDDCDGNIDEAYGDLNEACSVGAGACETAGVRICDADGMRTICGAEPGAPVNETCNGIDDDCDGEVDNGFDLGADCRGDDQCLSPGTTVCAENGAGVICDVAVVVAPVPETCDGTDDDCDGSIDEAFPTLAAPCVNGLGICERGGVFVCAPDGADVICDAEIGAPLPAELCNATDDDCDGRVDNGAPCPGDPGMRVTTLRIAEFGGADCGRDFTGDGAPDNALGAVAGQFNPALAEAFGPEGLRAILMRFVGIDGNNPVTLELLEAVRVDDGIVPAPRVIDPSGAALEQLPGLVPGNDDVINPEPGAPLSVPSPLFSTQARGSAFATASFLPMQQVVFNGDRQGAQVPTARISGLVGRQALLDAYAAAAQACADAFDPPAVCAQFGAFGPADLEANLVADADLDGTPAVSVCLILGAEPTATLPVGGQPCDDDTACFEGLVCRAASVTGDPVLGAALKRRCGPSGIGGLADGDACALDDDCVHGLCAAAVAGAKRCVSLCSADDECAAGVCRGIRVDLPDARTQGGQTAGVCLDLPGSGAACDTECADAEICGPWFAGGLANPGVEVVVEGRCQDVDPIGAELGATCDDAFDCAHGNGCVPDLAGVLRCAAPCVAADECGGGKYCIPRVALPEIGAAAAVVHGACLRVPAGVGSGGPCTADRDCLGEETCRAQALPNGDVTRYCARGDGFFTVGQPCNDAGECASGLCVGGVCGGLCDDDADCGSRLFCVADARVDDAVVLGGECQAPASACVRDVDCNAADGCDDGQCICETGQCARGCRFPSACADGLHCREDNVCAPFCRDDEAEPNDTLADATRLPLGRSAARVEQTAQLCDGSAVDWYSAVAPGLPFRFTVASLTEGVTLNVALIDAFGNALAEAVPNGDGFELLIDDPVDVTALSGQLVFLIVRGSGVEGGAEYRVIGEVQAPDCPDPAVEPRDESWEFTELLTDPNVNASERVDGWICPQDTDWYAINLQAGDRLTLDVEVLGNEVELPAELNIQFEGPDHNLVGTALVRNSLAGTGQIVFDMPVMECIDTYCHVEGIRTRIFCADRADLCSSMPWFVRVEGTEANTQSAYTLDASITRADNDLRCVPDVFEPDIVFDDPDRFQAIVGPQSVETVPGLPGILTFPYYQWQTMDARACGGDGGVASATDLDRVLMFMQPGDRIELDLSQDGAQRLQVDWYAQQADNNIIQQEFEVSVQPVYRTIFDPQFAGQAPFINGRYYGMGIVRGGNDGGAYQYSVPYTARFRRLPAEFEPDLDCAEPFTANLVFGQDNKAGDTRGASNDHQPGLCAGGGGADHVYRAITPAGGSGTLIATVTSADGTSDFGVSVRTVCDAVNTEVECNEDDLSAINPRERAEVRAQLDGGRPVFVIVDSFSPAHEGPYSLTVRWEPDAR